MSNENALDAERYLGFFCNAPTAERYGAGPHRYEIVITRWRFEHRSSRWVGGRRHRSIGPRSLCHREIEIGVFACLESPMFRDVIVVTDRTWARETSKQLRSSAHVNQRLGVVLALALIEGSIALLGLRQIIVLGFPRGFRPHGELCGKPKGTGACAWHQTSLERTFLQHKRSTYESELPLYLFRFPHTLACISPQRVTANLRLRRRRRSSTLN